MSRGDGNAHWRVDPTGASAASRLSGTGTIEMNTPPTGPRSASSSPSPTDKVDLSTALCAVASGLTGTDVRAERVAALRQLIAANSYNVPSSDIAGNLIRSLLKERT
jgi:anti-sigma28 factor (negative regulator of flagellin synthesis)